MYYYSVSELLPRKHKKDSDYSNNKKTIEYTCGCRYSFNHYTLLERVCPDHENEIIAQC